MNDKENQNHKRLVRLMVAQFVAIIVLLFAVVSLLSNQIAQVRSIALDADGRVVIGPVGPAGQGFVGPQGEMGPMGYQGLQGIQGAQGVPGVNGQDGVQGIQGEMGPQGPQGPQGETGESGRAVYVRGDKNAECRYEGMDEWMPIEECSP